MNAIARPVAAAGPAHGLGEELVRPLRGPLVGEVERDVGRHDAHERHLGDVEALGDEAGPDEDVEAARGERVEHAIRGALALDDVAIQAGRRAAPGTARGPRAPPAPCPRRGSGSAATRTTGSGSRAARRVRSGGSAAWSRPGGRRAAGRSPGRPGRVPQSRHTTTDAVPRRLITRIARSPASVSSAASAAASGSESSPRLPAASSARRSTARHRAARCPPAAAGSTARRYRPARAWPMLSTDGVALPRTTAAPASRASSSAASRAWNRGVRSLL